MVPCRRGGGPARLLVVPVGAHRRGRRLHRGVAEKWPEAGALCLAVAVAVAVERVHSGAHYPSDVAAGAVIGTVSRALPHAAPAALRRVRRFFPPPAPALRQWPGRPWRS
ncbi:phosphatase PAP2 family protein [Streptomyces sp. NBC_00664]|uniref:phosphatase PAP2 family protein n=1 Tax=unclassified Streptomyces TaxID=2593676 RepID=UPI002E3108CA|nr:phosphatase PAP2 family protein [Streptomyces sp. NBC_00664]